MTDGAWAVIYLHNQVLLVYKDRWFLPGAKTEAGETAYDTALREVWAQTGVTITKGKGRRKWTHLFKVVIDQIPELMYTAIEQDGPEVTRYKWVHPKDLQHYLPKELCEEITNM